MPDRSIFDVFNTAGVLVLRMGDISGRSWGGGAETLPEGTFGLWTLRDGAWLNGNVTMFYANSRSVSVNGSTALPSESGVDDEHVVVNVNEAFPFGTIRVRPGRVVTFEWFWHSNTFSGSFVDPTGRTFVGGGFVGPLRLRGSLNGGAEQDFDFMSGPTTGENVYTSMKIRLVYHVRYSSTGANLPATTFNWTITRSVSIRMFAHEAHAGTTLSVVSESRQRVIGSAANPSGEIETGRSGIDQGGGTGTAPGTIGGEIPGGIIIV